MEPQIIRARNKKTGQVFEGTVEEARKFGFSDEFILSKLKSSQELERVQSGQPELTADEKKKETQKSDLVKRVDLLEKNYNEAELKGPAAGRLGFISTLTGGAIAPEVSDYEALRKSLIGPVARTISSEAGVLTDQDIKRAEGLLPKLSDSDQVVKNKLENIRTLLGGDKKQTDTVISQGGGLGATPDIYQGEEKLYRQQFGPLTDLFTGAAKLQERIAGSNAPAEIGGVAGAVGGGPVVAGIGAGLGKSIQQKVANNLESGKTGLDAILQQPTAKQNLDTAATAGASYLTTLLLQKGTKVVGKALKPFKTVGDARAAAIAEAKGKTISGDKLLKSLEKSSKNISPTQSNAYSKFLESARQRFAGQEIYISDAVKLNQEANKAFTAAGKVGKSSTAAFNKAMGDFLKKEIKITAPDVAKANEFFSKLYGAQKFGKKLVFPAQTALLYKLLGKMGI